MKRGRPKGRSRDTRSFGPLGDLIRKHRLEKNLGLLDVAKACGCSVQFISNIEHGRAPLPWDKLPSLASFLKIPLEELQAANLAVRSDFRSFVYSSGKRSTRPAAKATGNGIATHKINGAASALALSVSSSVKDAQLQEILLKYQSASTDSKKRFVKAALKMFGDGSLI